MTDPSTQSSKSKLDSTDQSSLLEQIRLLGRTLDDLENMRKQSGNRIGAFERNLGLTIDYHDVIMKQLRVAEHVAELELKRTWRKHPLAEWAKGIHGVGEKSIARLIAEIGDPAERPNPGKLLAYCGHGEPLRKKRKGMTQEEAFKLGNPRAKSLVWLIATSMLKLGNREIYDARREKTKDRGWTPGHEHADALRIVGKEFLKRLWEESRKISSDHKPSETQCTRVAAEVCADHSPPDTPAEDRRRMIYPRAIADPISRS